MEAENIMLDEGGQRRRESREVSLEVMPIFKFTRGFVMKRAVHMTKMLLPPGIRTILASCWLYTWPLNVSGILHVRPVMERLSLFTLTTQVHEEN